jgi:hypothetical protein
MNHEQARPQRLTRAETKARTRALPPTAAAQSPAREGCAGATRVGVTRITGSTTGAPYANSIGTDGLHRAAAPEVGTRDTDWYPGPRS